MAADVAECRRARGRCGAAAQVWACCDGFVLHSLGVLGFEGADLVALTAVVGTALVIAISAAVARRRPALARGYAARGLPVLAAGTAAE